MLRRTPFEGDTFNEVLKANKQCFINFENPEYSCIPQTALDLLKKMLEIDPKKRINVTAALSHDYFKGSLVDVSSNPDEEEELEKIQLYG